MDALPNSLTGGTWCAKRKTFRAGGSCSYIAVRLLLDVWCFVFQQKDSCHCRRFAYSRHRLPDDCL